MKFLVIIFLIFEQKVLYASSFSTESNKTENHLKRDMDRSFSINDPLYSYQWYLHRNKNTGNCYKASVGNFLGGCHSKRIQKCMKHGVPCDSHIYWEDAVKSFGFGEHEVIVAILDTGVDASHPDLEGKMWKCPKYNIRNRSQKVHEYLCEEGQFGHNFKAYKYLEDDSNDYLGHGTGIAGIIAAKINNEQGISGICDKCRIMSLSTENGGMQDIEKVMIPALEFAIRNKARVINLSLGTVFKPSSLEKLHKVIKKGFSKGVIFIASAGNKGSFSEKNLEKVPYYPCQWKEVLCVASTDTFDRKSYNSSYGKAVDISAPGLYLLTTLSKVYKGLVCHKDNKEELSPMCEIFDNYGRRSLYGEYYSPRGTSFSVAVVSGASAFILSHRPDLEAQDVYHLIRQGADSLKDRNKEQCHRDDCDNYLGSGRINLKKSMDLLNKKYFK